MAYFNDLSWIFYMTLLLATHTLSDRAWSRRAYTTEPENDTFLDEIYYKSHQRQPVARREPASTTSHHRYHDHVHAERRVHNDSTFNRRSLEHRDDESKLSERSIPHSAGDVQRLHEDSAQGCHKGKEPDPASYKIINTLRTPFYNSNRRVPGPSEAPLPRPVSSTPRSGGAVVFPEPEAAPTASSLGFKPQIPAECQRSSLCTAVPNYPSDYINRLLLNKTGGLQHTVAVDEIEEDKVEIVQRFGGADVHDYELCSYYEKVVYPQAAQDKDFNWRVILNHEKFVQGFRVAICRNENGPCSPMASFPLDKKARCQQKYMLRPMAALDDRGNPYTAPFRLPSCCSCVVHDVG